MSTFFEKLTTGSKQEEEATPALAAVKEDLRRPARSSPSVKTAPAPALRLKVETEEKPVTPVREEPLEEEEGELTVDIYDAGDSLVIQSTVAGVKPEDLDVTITEDTVTIKGKRERPEDVSEEHYYYKELFWGTFSRAVILPEEIDDELAEAALKHGLLTIKLPKRKRGVTQKLKVKVT